MTGRVLGIDPGLASGGCVMACDLPVGSGTKAMISGPLLANLVLRYAPSRAIVEKVGPMPRQGLSSTFKFGRGVEMIEGVLGGELVPISYPSPTVSKRHFGLDADKEASRQKAIEIWPGSATELFSRKNDHGRADACLVALWAQRAAAAAGGSA